LLPSWRNVSASCFAWLNFPLTKGIGRIWGSFRIFLKKFEVFMRLKIYVAWGIAPEVNNLIYGPLPFLQREPVVNVGALAYIRPVYGALCAPGLDELRTATGLSG